MAKNYLQDGKTLTFIADEDYKSGDLVCVGERFVVAVTDIQSGSRGTGLTEGVFVLPKKIGEAFEVGIRVFVLDGKVVTGKKDGAIPLGTAWDYAKSGAAVVAVKLSG